MPLDSLNLKLIKLAVEALAAGYCLDCEQYGDNIDKRLLTALRYLSRFFNHMKFRSEEPCTLNDAILIANVRPIFYETLRKYENKMNIEKVLGVCRTMDNWFNFLYGTEKKELCNVLYDFSSEIINSINKSRLIDLKDITIPY